MDDKAGISISNGGVSWHVILQTTPSWRCMRRKQKNSRHWNMLMSFWLCEISEFILKEYLIWTNPVGLSWHCLLLRLNKSCWTILALSPTPFEQILLDHPGTVSYSVWTNPAGLSWHCLLLRLNKSCWTILALSPTPFEQILLDHPGTVSYSVSLYRSSYASTSSTSSFPNTSFS
jgi:hypothetical protein